MDAHTAGAGMTAADLERHRIGELEAFKTEITSVVRALEREVDRLKIEQAAVIGAVARLEGKLEERDQNLKRSLERLHERLDERLSEVAPVGDVLALKTELSKMAQDDLKHQGAMAERRRLWRQWRWITATAVAFSSMFIAALALILHAT